jgi:hypothetical protein
MNWFSRISGEKPLIGSTRQTISLNSLEEYALPLAKELVSLDW